MKAAFKTLLGFPKKQAYKEHYKRMLSYAAQWVGRPKALGCFGLFVCLFVCTVLDVSDCRRGKDVIGGSWC